MIRLSSLSAGRFVFRLHLSNVRILCNIDYFAVLLRTPRTSAHLVYFLASLLHLQLSQ